MGVIYFLVCVRKHDHESILPTNISTTAGKKHNDVQKKCDLDLLSETRLLPYFMTAWCVFLYNYPSVCVFCNINGFAAQ